MLKGLQRLVAGLNGEFVVFVMGAALLTAGVWCVWGMGFGLITAGAAVLGDIVMDRLLTALVVRQKGSDQ